VNIVLNKHELILTRMRPVPALPLLQQWLAKSTPRPLPLLLVSKNMALSWLFHLPLIY